MERLIKLLLENSSLSEVRTPWDSHATKISRLPFSMVHFPFESNGKLFRVADPGARGTSDEAAVVRAGIQLMLFHPLSRNGMRIMEGENIGVRPEGLFFF